MINLDSWFHLENWTSVCSQPKGVEAIDQCLKKQPTMKEFLKGSPKGPRKSPIKKLTPRRKNPSPKYYKDHVVNIPVAYCPKCNIYVKDIDKGVVCVPCQAYWHYRCANITQQELDENWKDKDFHCELHRDSTETEVEKMALVEAPTELPLEGSIKVKNIKINNYSLNEEGSLKNKLADMDKPVKITPKDGNRQYSIKLSTPTYHLFMENITNLGEQMGMEVKRDDVDSKGINVQCQWTAAIKVSNGPTIPFSITCYHTKNSMLIQLMGNNGEPKIKGLQIFVNKTLNEIIKKLENTVTYEEVKKFMKEELTLLLCNKVCDKKDETINCSKKVDINVSLPKLSSDGYSSPTTNNCEQRNQEEKDESPKHIADMDDGCTINDNNEQSITSISTSEPICLDDKSDTVTNDLRIRLTEESNERKKLMKEMQELKKKLKKNAEIRHGVLNL